MKPIYFCSNCKQYHASCLKQNQTHATSISYLRFSDLFQARPQPHLQNFTPNAKRVDFSRFVYEAAEGAGVGSRRGRYRKDYSHTALNDNRVTADGRAHTQKTTRKHQKTAYQPSKNLKTQQNQTSQKFDNALHPNQKTQRTNPQQTNKKQRGPYYITQKLQTMNSQKRHKAQITQDTAILQNSKTPIKSSFVYGDSNRKILRPKKQVREFHFGELVESREDQQELPFLQPPPYNSNSKVVQHVIRINGVDSQNKNQKHEDRVGSPKVNHLSQMDQLRQLLKSNQKNYSNPQTHRPEQSQSQIKFSKEAKFIQKQIKPRSSNHDQSQITPNSPVNPTPSIPSHITSKCSTIVKAQAKEYNRNKLCQQKEKCKYLDNRCLGFSFCEQGQINFIHGMSDLL